MLDLIDRQCFSICDLYFNFPPDTTYLGLITYPADYMKMEIPGNKITE